MKTIKNKITVTIIGIVVAAAIILGVFSYIGTQSSTMTAIEKNLIETSHIAGIAAQNAITTYTNTVYEIATSPILSDDAVSISEKNAFLDGKVAAYYMRSAGYINTSGDDLTAGVHVSNEEFFKNAMNGSAYMSAPYITEDKKDMYMVVSAPVKNGEQIVAVVYFVCDTILLSDIVQGVSVGEQGVSYILDKYGRTIASSDPAQVLNSVNAIEAAKRNPDDPYYAELSAVEQNMIAGKADIARYTDRRGESYIQSYTPIPGSDGWSIATAANVGEFLQSANTAALMQAAVILSLCVLVIFIAKAVGKTIAAPITACADRLQLMARGDLKSPVPQSAAKDETRTLINGLETAVTTLSGYVADIDRNMSEMASGRFDFEQSSQYVGDFKNIETSIAAFRATISSALQKITRSANQVSADSNQVSRGAQSLAQSATEQADSVEALSAEITKISKHIQQTSENAANLNQLAHVVGGEVTAGSEHMTLMTAAISDIRIASEQINIVIKTIEDIAFQTDILALNAAVEAARAGAAGKGFAVVADEVRNLANKSSEAVKQTNLLVEGSVKSVANGVLLADKTALSLSEVVKGAARITALIEQIAAACTEQSESITQIRVGVEQISSVVQINSATSEESAASSEELSGQADMMKSLVSMFRVGRASQPGSMSAQDDRRQVQDAEQQR